MRQLTIAAIGATLLAVGACGTAISANDDDPKPVAHEAASTKSGAPNADPDVEFAAVFAVDGADRLGDVALEMGDTSTSLTDMDIRGGIDHATEAADLLDALIADFDYKDETAGSALGRDTMETLRGCSLTYRDVAVALSAMNVQDIQDATADLDTCNAGLGDLNDRVSEIVA